MTDPANLVLLTCSRHSHKPWLLKLLLLHLHPKGVSSIQIFPQRSYLSDCLYIIGKTCFNHHLRRYTLQVKIYSDGLEHLKTIRKIRTNPSQRLDLFYAAALAQQHTLLSIFIFLPFRTSIFISDNNTFNICGVNGQTDRRFVGATFIILLSVDN